MSTRRPLRTRTDAWRVALLAVIAAPLACGRSAQTGEQGLGSNTGGSDGNGGSSTTGSTSTGLGGDASSMSATAGTTGVTGVGGSAPVTSGPTAGWEAGGSPTTTIGGASQVGQAGGAPVGTPMKGENGFFACDSPEAYGHADSGYVLCAAGFIHRPEAKQCTSLLASDGDPGTSAELPIPPEGDAGVVTGTCADDSECTDAPHGYCGVYDGPNGGPYCGYGCVEDAECAEGQICLCGERIGTCVEATCASDAECSGGAMCVGGGRSACGRPQYFACQTPEDTCGGDAHCGDGFGSVCASGGTFDFTGGPWSCIGECVEGRPFFVHHELRQATATSRTDWCDGGTEPAPDLSTEQRTSLVEHWTRIALMEHASIAAFARFQLQLLSLGAPPELVVATTAAIADETRHARVAFGLASRFGSESIGPGSLDVRGALDELSLEEIVTTAVIEGCIGETYASVEAAEAWASASDPEVVRVLQGIAEDERRHSELAWSFVRWSIATYGEPARRAAERGFETGIAALLAAPAVGAPGLESYGVLGAETVLDLRREIVRDVVLPCKDALFRGSAEAPARRAGLTLVAA